MKTWEEEFDEKFLYSVTLGSTLNDGNDGTDLRWKVGDGEMPDIDSIKDFIRTKIAEAEKRGEERVKGLITDSVVSIEMRTYPFTDRSEEEKRGYMEAFEDVKNDIIDELKSI